MVATFREWLEERRCREEDLDRFFDPSRNNWARFDPELGYVLHDCMVQDGVDDAYSLYHYGPGGERRMLNFADLSCRINTYGNSFTQCHQVSDGETWQEALAAHFGEPIRNFGVGGYGVFQAYRRMRRVEETDSGAENILFYLWYDDHRRSLFPCRWLFTHSWSKRRKHRNMFHSNPWTHLALDLEKGKFGEMPNPFPTERALRALCKGEAVYEAFKDNVFVNLEAMREGVRDVDWNLIAKLAEWAHYPLAEKPEESDDPAGMASDLFRIAAHRATFHILGKLDSFVREKGKNLLILLGYSRREIRRVLEGGERWDRDILDYLEERGFQYADIMAKHREDFADFRLSPEEYVNRYYIGHYNPKGNLFFAFAIKDAIVSWLEPKPRTYAHRGESIRFEGYLDD